MWDVTRNESGTLLKPVVSSLSRVWAKTCLKVIRTVKRIVLGHVKSSPFSRWVSTSEMNPNTLQVRKTALGFSAYHGLQHPNLAAITALRSSPKPLFPARGRAKDNFRRGPPPSTKPELASPKLQTLRFKEVTSLPLLPAQPAPKHPTEVAELLWMRPQQHRKERKGPQSIHADRTFQTFRRTNLSDLAGGWAP